MKTEIKKLNASEMCKIEGGGWFSQIFGRDWGPCVKFADSPGGDGIYAQHGESWLWGDGIRPC